MSVWRQNHLTGIQSHRTSISRSERDVACVSSMVDSIIATSCCRHFATIGRSIATAPTAISLALPRTKRTAIDFVAHLERGFRLRSIRSCCEPSAGRPRSPRSPPALLHRGERHIPLCERRQGAAGLARRERGPGRTDDGGLRCSSSSRSTVRTGRSFATFTRCRRRIS